MSIERRISDTLRRADQVQPSPDLFRRVQRSLEEDLAFRRRRRLVAAGITVFLAAIAVFSAAVVSPSPSGSLLMPRWALELVTNVVLIVLVLTLGPAIRRFGRIYTADVFHLDPAVVPVFLALLDIAFYLVFFGQVLVGVELGGLDRHVVLPSALAGPVMRIGLLLLTMGALHATTLIGLSVIGLVFSATVRRVRRRGPGAPPASPGARRADVVATAVVWALAAGLLPTAILLILSVFGGMGE